MRAGWLRVVLVVVIAVGVNVAIVRYRLGTQVPPVQAHHTVALDTFVEYKTVSPDPAAAHTAMVRSVSAMVAVGDRLNFYDPNSELSALNRATKPMVASPLLGNAMRTCLTIARETNGALDPTMGFLSEHIWRFDQETFQIPAPFMLVYARPFYGWQGATLRETAAGAEIDRATPRLKFELGAIAKGCALVAGASAMREAGFDSFLINAGGDLVARGMRGPGRPWRVGIQHPRRNTGITFATIEVTDEAVATSGDYQRYAIAEGLRYHHIIDPQTGFPSNASLSATVVAPSPDTADALATAAFVLGERAVTEIPRLAPALGCRPEQLSVLVVLPNGRVVHTPDARWTGTPPKLTLVAPEDSLDP